MNLSQLTLSLAGPKPATIPILGKLSHLGDLGLRFYADEVQSGVFVCAAWPANAFAGKSVIDWTKLSITALAGWTIAAHPRLGLRVSAGSISIGDGQTMQCFPTRRGLAPIRFVLAAPGKTAALSLLDAGSIPNPVKYFGPLGQRQPNVDRDAYFGSAVFQVNSIRDAIATGSAWIPQFPGLDYECGIVDQSLGVWQPLGPRAESGNPGGGNPAGADIRTLPGYDQTLPGALLERQRMDQAIERQLHAWDPITGDYLTQEQLPGIQYSASRDPYNSDAELPGFQVPAAGDSKCPYYGYLIWIGAYDWAHYPRAINPAMVAWEYLKDPVAADFLVDLAEEARLCFSDNGPVNTQRDPQGNRVGWEPRNLANYYDVAKSRPHHGGDCGRYRAWPGWAVAMAHRVRPRREYKRWAKVWCAWCDTLQMPNGLWQWSYGDAQFHNPPHTAGAQMFEQEYVAFARVALGKVNGDSGTPILKGMDALFANRSLARQPYVWNAGMFGPPHFLAVGDASTGEPYLTVKSGWSGDSVTATGDPANVDAAIALAWSVSDDADKYRSALLKYGFPANTLADKLKGYAQSMDKNWSAAAEAMAQGWVT